MNLIFILIRPKMNNTEVLLGNEAGAKSLAWLRPRLQFHIFWLEFLLCFCASAILRYLWPTDIPCIQEKGQSGMATKCTHNLTVFHKRKGVGLYPIFSSKPYVSVKKQESKGSLSLPSLQPINSTKKSLFSLHLSLFFLKKTQTQENS